VANMWIKIVIYSYYQQNVYKLWITLIILWKMYKIKNSLTLKSFLNIIDNDVLL